MTALCGCASATKRPSTSTTLKQRAGERWANCARKFSKTRACNVILVERNGWDFSPINSLARSCYNADTILLLFIQAERYSYRPGVSNHYREHLWKAFYSIQGNW